MKCTNADNLKRELQHKLEQELILAVKAHGGNEYVFFDKVVDLENGKDGPFVNADDGYSNESLTWKVSRVKIINDLEIEVFGFRMDSDDWDEESQIGYLESSELQSIIEAIPETHRVKDVSVKSEKMKKLYHTNYAVAVSWCNNDIVRCNKLPEIDPSIWENFNPIVDLAYVPDYDEDGEEIKPTCPECGGELIQNGPNMVCSECGECEEPSEIFQWYITDCSKSDVDYLSETFGLLFTYSDLLDCYILCVTHYGTAWDYVNWTTTNPNAERKLGEKK